MAWQTPKTNWKAGDVLASTDFNRIEGNILELKSEVDQAETPSGAQAKVNAHANLTNAHSATSAATANRIMMRDSAGRAKVAAPAASDDIARLAEVNTRARIITGTYVGDNASSRFINVGAPPVFVIVVGDAIHYGAAGITWMFDPRNPLISSGSPAVGPLISGNGFEVGYISSQYNQHPPNKSGVTYHWIAFIK